MTRIAPLFLALTLTVPNLASASPTTHDVADDNSAGWMMDILTDLAETLGPNVPTEVSESAEDVASTRSLLIAAVQFQSHVFGHHDGAVFLATEVTFRDDGGYRAIILISDEDDWTTALPLEVFSNGSRVGVRAAE